MKLLVAIDSSKESKFVVDEVAGRPWPSGTTVCVLHVIDWPQPASDASLLPAFPQLQRSSSKRLPMNFAGLACRPQQRSSKVILG